MAIACLADIFRVFHYELNTMHYLFQAFEHDQLATIIIFILKVKKQTNEAQKGYLTSPVTQLLHVGISVKTHANLAPKCTYFN